jgi:hypothetical protein
VLPLIRTVVELMLLSKEDTRIYLLKCIPILDKDEWLFGGICNF